LVEAGRGNREEQRVLYVAGDKETAVAEIRAALAEDVSVCRHRLTRAATVCDLTADIERLSPFTLSEAEFRRYQLNDHEAFIRRTFSRLLSLPVRPSDAPTQYIKSQFLARMVVLLDYDGIRYASSQRGGEEFYNYLFFDPSIAEPVGPVEQCTVIKIARKLRW
jgi:RES domain